MVIQVTQECKLVLHILKEIDKAYIVFKYESIEISFVEMLLATGTTSVVCEDTNTTTLKPNTDIRAIDLRAGLEKCTPYLLLL